jgi:hypothetical protein
MPEKLQTKMINIISKENSSPPPIFSEEHLETLSNEKLLFPPFLSTMQKYFRHDHAQDVLQGVIFHLKPVI